MGLGDLVVKKLKVATGIFWVEIPEANLRLLCGCPADSVKHMMKKGLIVTEEKQGVSFESGPNAILLSDLLIQNGRFANLAEFPVLQMLYRQGLILPNHPNNTGIKPMLIGSQEQLNAQSEYIYRGNYGLTSIEEIVETGVSEEEAAEMFRLKKRFAFDHIRKTEELLGMTVVDHEKTEIMNGVFIERKRVNVFEISYQSESVIIDLNLATQEVYEPAYKLGFYDIQPEYFSIIHSGDGDGWDIYRPCMASILTWQGKIYLIDAGPNVLNSLHALGIGMSEVEGIFQTHAHDDHFNGLTALLRSDHKIKHFATPLIRASVIKKFAALTSIDENLFYRYFDVQELKPGQWNNIEGLEVKAVNSPHPIETTIMYFRALWGEGYKTYAHLADITSFDVLEGMITDDASKSGITRDYFNQIKQEYLTPVCLKKIDIGGGLIHGCASDFEDDPTPKKVLSHTALELNDTEKELGESATFGMKDVLIPASKDFIKSKALQYFQTYFHSVPTYELNMLLNCPMVTFNPGTIIISKGEENKNIYFILSGILEFIDIELGINNKLTAGSLAGELSGISGTVTTGTYRSASYVKAIEIPTQLYTEFLKRNQKFDSVINNIEKRQFLAKSWLFGERLSCPMRNFISQDMTLESFDKGQSLPDGKGLFMLEQGEIIIYSRQQAIETVKIGSFFGEESIIYNQAKLFTAQASQPSSVYRIPAQLIEDIPVVQFKLFEVLKKRQSVIENHTKSPINTGT